MRLRMSWTISDTKVCVCSVTIAEIYQGMRNRERKETLAMVRKFNTIHFDAKISFRFLSLKLRYRESLSIPDAIIAATSLVYNLQLFTFNSDDFRYIPGNKFVQVLIYLHYSAR